MSEVSPVVKGKHEDETLLKQNLQHYFLNVQRDGIASSPISARRLLSRCWEEKAKASSLP